MTFDISNLGSWCLLLIVLHIAMFRRRSHPQPTTRAVITAVTLGVFGATVADIIASPQFPPFDFYFALWLIVMHGNFYRYTQHFAETWSPRIMLMFVPFIFILAFLA